MMLSVMVVGAGAAFSDQSKIKNTEAVDACTALNIIGGYPDGSFKPEGNITRAEVTKMICVALNGGKNPAVSTNTTPTFSDVRNNANAAWAEGYIESCAAQGIVSGVGGGKFAPNGNVTGVQLAKMLLVSLGYKSENEGFTGNAWATNVNVRAAQKGLYAGLEKMDTSAAITRDNAARMVWNALNAYEVEYKTTLVTDSKGQLTSQITVQDKVGIDNLSQKLTLLRDKYEAVIYEGTLKASGKYNAMNATGAGSDKLVVDVKYVDGTDVSGRNYNNQALKCKKDFTDLLGQYVKVMYDTKDKTVYGVFPVADENTVISATMGDVDAVAVGATKVKVDGTEYDLENAVASTDTNVYGAASDDFNSVFTGANSATKVKFISNDGNDKIDLAIVVPVNVYEITYVGSDNITLKNLNGAPALGNIKKSDCVISGDLAKDDYVSVIGKEYNFDGKYEVTKLTTTEGKTEQIKTASSATTDMKVGGTWYTLLTGLKDDNNNQIAVDTTYKFAAVDGYVYYAEKVSGGATKVALVTGVSSNTNFDGYVQTRLMLTDGTEITDYMGEIEQDDDRMENIEAGSLVAYEKDDDHYNLFLIGKDYTDAKNDDKAKASYDSVVGVTNESSYDVNGAAWNKETKTVAGTKVNDSAVVFVASKKSASKNDVVYKVITGKQLNDWKTNFGTAGVGLKNNSGLGYLDVAYVTGTNAVTPNTTTKYAYVTSDIAAGTDFVTYSIWDGSSEKSIEVTEKVTSTNAAKNTVISFDWDGEGVVKNVEKVSDFGAIQYSNGKQVKINGKGYDLADDVTILNVDTDKKEGVPGTAINEAQKDSDGNYYYNAIYVYDAADDEIDLLVIDVKNNKWTGKSEVVTEGTTAAEINAALDAAGDNGTVVVTGTLPDSGVQALKAGQTLIVNAAQTYAKVAAVGAEAGAKLVLKQATSDNAKGDVFKDKDSTSYKNSKVKADTYTASVSSSTVTWTGTLAK